jgi:hypothetical protein
MRTETRLALFLLRRAGGEIGHWLRCYGLPLATLSETSQVFIGNRVTLTSRSHYPALGVSHQVILRTLAEGSQLVSGDDAGLSRTTVREIGQPDTTTSSAARENPEIPQSDATLRTQN